MKHILLSVALLLTSAAAFAHPHEDETQGTKSWPFFGNSDAADTDAKAGTSGAMDIEEFAEKLGNRLESHGEKMERSIARATSDNKFLKNGGEIDSLEDMRDAAKAVEEVLAESGLISSLADMVVDLAEDFEVENDDEGISLNFDGKRLGRMKIDKNRDESFDLEGFGRNLTINRKTVRQNGKTKTRIVIELDGEDDFDVELTPKSSDN